MNVKCKKQTVKRSLVASRLLGMTLITLVSFLISTPVQAACTCQCNGCPAGDSGITIQTDDAAACTAYCTAGGGRECSAGACAADTGSSNSGTTSGGGLQNAGNLVQQFASNAGFHGTKAPEVIIGEIIQGAMLVIGVVFGILVVYGGYLWMIARGNEEQVKKSIGILETAVIGFIIVVAAYAITTYIVEKVISAAYL